MVRSVNIVECLLTIYYLRLFLIFQNVFDKTSRHINCTSPLKYFQKKNFPFCLTTKPEAILHSYIPTIINSLIDQERRDSPGYYYSKALQPYQSISTASSFLFSFHPISSPAPPQSPDQCCSFITL